MLDLNFLAELVSIALALFIARGLVPIANRKAEKLLEADSKLIMALIPYTVLVGIFLVIKNVIEYFLLSILM